MAAWLSFSDKKLKAQLVEFIYIYISVKWRNQK